MGALADSNREGIAHFDGGGKSPGPTVAAAWLEVEATTDELVACFPDGTHNVAEWKALLLALTLARSRGVTHLTVYGDSRLVIEQANGDSKVKKAELKPLHGAAMRAKEDFADVRFKWIPREQNWRADELGRKGVIACGSSTQSIGSRNA